mmetsp:Transcript_28311/g.47613  ORF Transcript_28311/g.47613 Transcript_28311/m.47613 type:complete len:346 (-) Transcript_28311:366-1403(-)
MSVFRKALSRSLVQATRYSRQTAIPQALAARRSFNTINTFDAREHAEEDRYIHAIEAERQQKIRENIERILALEDHHEEKQDLMEILEKKEPEGMVAKLGLDDWKFALPLGLFVAIPALSNEVLVLDAETQLVACFILFCSTMYTQVGGMMAKSLDDYSQEIYDDLKNVDDSMLEQINAAVAANEMALSLEEDFKQYTTLTDQLAMAQADLLNHREAHMYRDAIVKKLDSLQALEDSAVQAMKSRLLTQVKSDVVNTFTNDKKAKDAALARAMDVLASGAKGKLGKDVVGEVFASSIASYKENYAKQPADSDPILQQLEKDMAAVATAPVVESTGGNVFVTHPLV